jgi:hypothetical protein
MSVTDELQKLDRAALIRLLERVYGIYGDIDEIIESHVAAGEPASESGVTASLEQRIAQLAAEQDFVGLRASYAFSTRLRNLLEDIDVLLCEQNPLEALRLMDEFLQLVEPVLARVDDSGGDVGEVFREAVDQWLNIAAQVRALQPDHLDWVARVQYYFDNNDYGCLDNVIGHSRQLLTTSELQQLAQQFEAQAVAALQPATSVSDGSAGGSSYSFTAARACIGLASVGEALGDIAIYEKSTLLTSPEPNALQMARLVSYAISIGAYERAEYWLAKPGWDAHRSRHRDLSRKLLLAQGKTDELKRALQRDFEQEPSMDTLYPYWEQATGPERQRIAEQVDKLAAQRAKTGAQPRESINLLLYVDHGDFAAQQLVAQPACVEGMYYVHLLRWAETFEQRSCALAAAICYRGLLTDLLERGYAKAYRHGARYFHKLLALDKRIQNYNGLSDAQQFIREIQEVHWRKRSFWAEADYPNKPLA